MTTPHAPVPIETLLSHREWVRQLARSLVRDEAAADDAEQRTWLAALRRPPEHEATARAWLARVVRNVAFNARRDARRRAAYELAVPSPPAVRSPADVVAEAEAHRRVVRAVHGLSEPYRTTVLMRWFEDLSPTVIAARMDVPRETVRTRLRRAHGLLRRDLESGSERALAFAAPLLTGRGSDGASGANLATATVAAGGTVMGIKTIAVVGACAIVIVTAALVARRDAREKNELAAARDRIAVLEARLETMERGEQPRASRSAAGKRPATGLEPRRPTNEPGAAGNAPDATSRDDGSSAPLAPDRATPPALTDAQTRALRGLLAWLAPHDRPEYRKLDVEALARTEYFPLFDLDLLDGRALELVTHLPRLRTLNLSGSRFTARGLAALAGERLERLIAHHSTLDDEAMATLAAMKHLRSLDAIDLKITSKGLAHLRDLPDLRRLNLSGSRIDRLPVLPASLEELVLARTALDDGGLDALNDLRRLRRLDLSGTRVTDDALDRLWDLFRRATLRHLNLSATRITDEALRKLQQHDLGGLRHLRLERLSFSDPAALESLRRRYPDLTVTTTPQPR